MRKHEVPKLKYVLVFGLTVIVFLFGVLLGNYFTERKFESINAIEDNLRIQTEGAELQYLLLLQEPCNYINSTPLADELYRISERLDFMESQRGEHDPDVLRLKNTYSLLELRHWLFTLKTNEQCHTKQIPIIYFYSNQGDCDKCKEQGYTLTYLRKKYPELRIYAFDIHIENPALNTIKKIHDVQGVPTLIINNTHYGFMTLDELDAVIAPYNLTIVQQ
jgi:glutaredoxin